MKIILLSLFILLNSSLYGISLDKYISAMQKASPQKRVKMMNNLKLSLAKMNGSDRQKAISKLRARTSTKPSSFKTTPTAILSKIATTERMNQTINFNNTQIINQTNIKDIYNKQNLINNPSSTDIPQQNLDVTTLTR